MYIHSSHYNPEILILQAYYKTHSHRPHRTVYYVQITIHIDQDDIYSVCHPLLSIIQQLTDMIREVTYILRVEYILRIK